MSVPDGSPIMYVGVQQSISRSPMNIQTGMSVSDRSPMDLRSDMSVSDNNNIYFRELSFSRDILVKTVIRTPGLNHDKFLKF